MPALRADGGVAGGVAGASRQRDSAAPNTQRGTMARFNRLLLTGAAGDLGQALRQSLAPLCMTLRLNDRVELGPAAANEETVVADLADFDAVRSMVEGVDAIVHFGGASRERVWQDVLDSTIRGSYHLYEAARQHGVRRIVYASSIHSVGFQRSDAGIDERAEHRPDSLYGLSKCFTEDLAKLSHDKWGNESVCLRILSCFSEPVDRRMLGTWLSYADMCRLVERALTANTVGHSVIYGVSDNPAAPVSNRYAGHIGYAPQDNAEEFRARVEAATEPADPTAGQFLYVGGWFTDLGHPDEA